MTIKYTTIRLRPKYNLILENYSWNENRYKKRKRKKDRVDIYIYVYILFYYDIILRKKIIHGMRIVTRRERERKIG